MKLLPTRWHGYALQFGICPQLSQRSEWHRRFFMLSYVCWAVFLGFAARRSSAAITASSVGTSAGGRYGFERFHRQLRSRRLEHNRVAERYGLDILEDLPKGAVLITEGDDVAFVLDYLLRVEGKRPDLTLYNRVGRGSDMLDPTERRLSGRQQQKLQQAREAQLAGERPLCSTWCVEDRLLLNMILSRLDWSTG